MTSYASRTSGGLGAGVGSRTGPDTKGTTGLADTGKTSVDATGVGEAKRVTAAGSETTDGDEPSLGWGFGGHFA